VTAALAVYRTALRRASAGHDATLTIVDAGGRPIDQIDPRRWTAELVAGDESMLARCRGATLDAGCGPGRLTAALRRRGHPALGIDVSAEAVRQARRRGAPALMRDVFKPVPMQGRWRTILLADGNIGIGGDPRRLLRRCAELLQRGGAVVAEVHPPGSPTWAGEIALHDGERRSDPFQWAQVGASAVAELARAADLRTTEQWTEAQRWFVRLTR
jgi:SAM-dependent methyltransferase